jgi:hypothetical protein
MGFTFDDAAGDLSANSLSDLASLTGPLNEHGQHNSQRIKPFIGGEEVNDSPSQEHRRFSIDFGDFPLERSDGILPLWVDASPEQRDRYLSNGVVPVDFPDPVAADWPELLTIVKDRVKPERDRQNRASRKKFWWRYGEWTPALLRATSGLQRVIVISRVTPHHAFALAPARTIFSEALVVFAFEDFGSFARLQSRVHETWVRMFSSSMKDDLRYTPSDSFENFPSANGSLSDCAPIGQAFYDARAARMVVSNEGLTATHNRMDDPEERDPAILHIRTLHDAMDAAVLRAYGWPHAIPVPIHEPEWPGGEDDRSGPWRRRWPEADRARVLEFLWQLNEAQSATEAAAARTTPAPRRRSRRAATLAAPLLETL